MSRQFKSTDTSKWIYYFGTGADGDLTISSNTTEAPIDASCSGTSGTTSLSATNASFATGQAIIIHKSRGNTTVTCGEWELNWIASYTTGTITTLFPLQFSYNDSGNDQSQVRVIKQYTNLTINAGVTYTAKSWDENIGGIPAFLVNNSLTINGTLNLTGNAASGSTAGTGVGFKGGAQNQTGEGSVGARVTGQQSRNGSGGGTGNGSSQVSGAGGGNGTVGANGYNNVPAEVPAVQGGTTTGNAALTIATFGGGGGGNNTVYNYAGGAGGGFALLIAKFITVNASTGSITANGGAGAYMRNGDYGGNGAGGSILMKCYTASLGTNRITATGGASGRIHLDYGISYTGTTNPTLDAIQDTSLLEPAGGHFITNFL